jgi:hypothetical protein
MGRSDEQGGLSRRDFVKAGAAAAAVAGMPLELRAAGPGGQKKGKKKGLVPTRVLGRTGVEVSILNFGSAQQCNDRLLNAAYDAGIRYIDTADCYSGGNSEKTIGQWMAKKGNREEFFLVTKDHPETPGQWVEMVDRRLEALQTDVIDLFFIHELGKGYQGGGEESHRKWPKFKKWGKAADQLKKSGKVKFVGFSTHTAMPLRIALLNNAAAGGWVDAIMLAYDPQAVKENKRFNKALDKCHKAGVGLICMKEMRAVQHVPKFLPEFEALGLTSHQAVLHAVWSDERIASICSAMSSLNILQENATAAKNFKPLDEKTAAAVIGLYERYALAYCNSCDGRCSRAAGTPAALGDIARYLSYYEADGCRTEARQAYAALPPEQRDWQGADLAAASQACISKLDFASILPRAEEKLA